MTLWILFGIEPETFAIWSHSTISSENIVWMSDVEASWSHISVLKTKWCMDSHYKIVRDNILSFSSIFKEDGVTQNIENYILV